MIGTVAALLVLGSSAAAQGGMPAVRPQWSVTLAEEPDVILFEGAHAVVIQDGELAHLRLTDGARDHVVRLAGCDALYRASANRILLPYDPVAQPSPNGLLVWCSGGTGFAPISTVAALDLATLSPRWLLQETQRHLSPWVEHRGLVLLQALAIRQPVRIVALDAATGVERWSVAPAIQHECSSIFQDAGGIYHVSCRGQVAALERDTGAERWHTDAGLTRFAVLAGDRLVLAGQTRVRALDLASGREAWHLDVPHPVAQLQRSGSGDVLVQIHAGDLLALSTRDGSIRWRAATGGATWLAPRGDRIAVAGPTGLRVLDRVTGRELAALATTDEIAAEWTGDTIAGVRTVPTGQEQRPSGRLFHLDPVTGATWSQGPAAFADPPVRVGGLLVACSDSGVVHAFDAATGAGRWRGFVGTRDGPGSSGCELYPSEADGLVLARGANRRLHAFALTGARRTSARVVVTGKVAAAGSLDGIRVRVGDVWTRTDATGSFRVAVRGSGTITAHIDPRDATRRCAYAESDSAPLQGQPRLRLRLVPDHCACHACD